MPNTWQLPPVRCRSSMIATPDKAGTTLDRVGACPGSCETAVATLSCSAEAFYRGIIQQFCSHLIVYESRWEPSLGVAHT
jgi:hypothetical protein